MNFPTKENDVAALANEMAGGLAAQAVLYPAPPVSPVSLNELLTTFNTLQNQVVAAKAAMEAATEAKLDMLENMIEGMKQDIKYAEMTVGNDDPKLKLIGWGARKNPTPLAIPGPAQFLTANPQGEGWLLLQWQPPLEGGKPSAYKVLRRKRSEGGWQDVGTATECSINLSNQERGVEWEYCVKATNKAGDGLESNIVMAVL